MILVEPLRLKRAGSVCSVYDAALIINSLRLRAAMEQQRMVVSLMPGSLMRKKPSPSVMLFPQALAWRGSIAWATARTCA